jgi:hypothetical protein
VHWLADGHATPLNPLPGSIVIGVGVPGAVGLNVTSRPAPPTTVHWLADGHATAPRPWVLPFWSIAIGADHESDAAPATAAELANNAEAHTTATSKLNGLLRARGA